METRRATLVAVEERLNPHSGEPETIRHRAIVKEERREDGGLWVFDILLVEDSQGQYTENGEIWQSLADGSRWRGPGRGPENGNGWRAIYSLFWDLVDQYRDLRGKPDGWWVADERGSEEVNEADT